ncbi:MAG: replication factor C large subunit [archaeon]
MLVHKYKPKKLEDIKGQDFALKRLRDSVLKKKHVLIYGDIGTGKTCSVYALARELDYEIFELNASDYRNKEQIESLIGSSSQQLSLFKKGKIILIDEIDGLNIKDRGGLQALIGLLDKSAYPIVIIGNDIWDSKFSLLRRKCDVIEFNRLKDLDIFNILKEISKKEDIKVGDKVLNLISKNSRGDARAAINDLEIMNIDTLRERKEHILEILKLIFKSKDVNLILKRFSNSDDDLDEIMLWLEENIPREYYVEYLDDAYNKLGKADIFRKRILRWQYYRFLVYQSFLMSVGIALSKDKVNKEPISYKRNERILKMWINKNRYAYKQELAEDISEKCNMSIKKAYKEISYMKFLQN